MIGSKTRLMFGAVLGLLVALAANAAAASIICDLPPAEQFSVSLEPIALDAGMTPKAPRPSSPPDDGQTPPTVDHFDDLAPAGESAGPPSSASQAGGSGTSSAAITAVSCALPQTPLQTSLPREASPYLPTGPPFELLRPPRLGLAATGS